MSIPVRQSTAFECSIGPVLDADGVAFTGAVVGDFKIKKTTGNFAALNGSATLTHVSVGVYDLVLTTSDTDTVGLLTVAIDDTVNACAPVRMQVMEEATYDMLYAASAAGYIANQPVDVNTIKTQTVTCAAGVTVLASVGTAATSTPQTGDSYAIVNNGTHGNAALLARTPSATSITNMNIVFATDFATNYNTTTDGWNVNATHWGGTAVASANVRANVKEINDDAVDTSIAQLGVNTVQAGGTAWGSGAITSGVFAAGAITGTATASSFTDEIETAAGVALAAIRLDELLAADSDIDGAAPPTTGSVFFELMSKSGVSFTFDQTTDSLEALRDLAATLGTQVSLDTIYDDMPTAAENAAAAAVAVWSDNLGGYSSGQAGGALVIHITDLAVLAADWLNNGRLDLIIDAILADTNELQTDWVNGGRLDLIVDAILEDTGTTLDGRIPAALTGAGNMKCDALLLDGGAPDDTIEAAVLLVLSTTDVTDFTAIPAGTPNILETLGFLYAQGFYRKEQTATTTTLFDGDNDPIAEATTSDDGTTFVRTRFAAP